MNNKSTLLIHEPALQVLPSLATEIGLNEAVILQQIHYWLEVNRNAEKNFEDGHYWSYNSYDKWQKENFPFWSVATVKRAFNKLKDLELIKMEQRRKSDYDRRYWVTINYDKLNKLQEHDKNEDNNDGCSDRIDQNDPYEDGKVISSTYTETTTETNDSATAHADGDVSKNNSKKPIKKKRKPRKKDPVFEAMCECLSRVPYSEATDSNKSYARAVQREVNGHPDLKHNPPTVEEWQTYRKRYARAKPELTFPDNPRRVANWIANLRGKTKKTRYVGGATQEEVDSGVAAVIEQHQREMATAEQSEAQAKLAEIMGEG